MTLGGVDGPWPVTLQEARAFCSAGYEGEVLWCGVVVVVVAVMGGRDWLHGKSGEREGDDGLD